MEEILEKLIDSPKLPFYSQYIQSVLSKESIARERFYEELEEDVKAEFINGEVVVHSPVKLEHNMAGNHLFKLLDTYVQFHGLGVAGYEKMLVCLTRNDYEPDICFWKKEKSDQFERRQVKFPAPNFIAEVISPATEKNDRTVKMVDYATHGVEEYWIVDPSEEVVEQYVLENEAYVLKIKADSGVVKSRVVAGFDIPVRALFDGERNLVALRRIFGG